MSFKHPYPVPTVRLIVRDSSKRVLILQRSRGSHSEGAWSLPGGKIDYGETIVDSVAREMREETALTCVSQRFLFHQDSLPLEPGGMHCINFYFECVASGKISLDRESSGFAWVGPDGLHRYEIAFRNDEGLERYWRDANASAGPGTEGGAP